MGTLLDDLRSAFRQLRFAPAFSFFVLAILAIGMGANTAVFSLINTTLLRALPYPDGDHLVQLSGAFQGRGNEWSVSLPNAQDWRARSRSMEDIAYYQGVGLGLIGQAGPERVIALRTSANLFTVLRTRPVFGRTYTTNEARPGGAAVAVLGWSLWQRQFAGARDVLGRTIKLGGTNWTVIGVMPREFNFPAAGVDLWIPLQVNPAAWPRDNGGMRVIGRLAPRQTIELARRDFAAISAALARQYPASNAELTAFLQSWREVLYGGQVRTVLFILFAAVGFVLLIVCLNIAGLLLARGISREREVAIRISLGGGRKRLLRQLMVESAVLAGLGGAAGLVVALAITKVLPRGILEGSGLPTDFGVDLRVLAFSAALSLLSAMLFGLAPALRTSRASLLLLISPTLARRHQFRRNLLVVGEVAVATVLVMGAGLMIRSLDGLLRNTGGFDQSQLLIARTQLELRYESPEQVARFQRQALAAVSTLPGVLQAGIVDFVPLSGTNNFADIQVEGQSDTRTQSVGRVLVSPGYQEAMRMPLLIGRTVGEEDVRSRPGVVVVNQTLARRHWGDAARALGQRILLDYEKGEAKGEAPYWRTVIGVVGDVRHTGLDEEPRPEIYVPFAQHGYTEHLMTWAIRTDSDPLLLLEPVKRAIWSVDAALPLFDVRTMERVVSASGAVALARLLASVLTLFGSLALLLAALGVYATLTFAVGQRTAEIGVRAALGANRPRVLRMILSDGLRLALAGLLLGLAGSIVLGRLLGSFMHQVQPLDPVAFTVTTGLLLLVALAASYLPAQRAMRISPMTALRQS